MLFPALMCKEVEYLLSIMADSDNRYQAFHITEQYTKLESNLGFVLPIDGRDIRGFKQWVCWNGYRYQQLGYTVIADHKGYDFASYIAEDSKCYLGLPAETPVKAIADGTVTYIENRYGPYYASIHIKHGEGKTDEDNGLFSDYCHVNPEVQQGQKVKKGDIIATLYKDEGSLEGNLVHLHFSLTHGWNKPVTSDEVDPARLYPSLVQLTAHPQGRISFTVFGLEYNPEIKIANFEKLIEPK